MNQDQPSQNQPKDQTKTQGELSQKELDHLQIQWILGKNRGEKTPLEKKNLIHLLDAGRIKWDKLHIKEQGMLRDDPKLYQQIIEWKNRRAKQEEPKENKDDLALRLSKKVTLGLVQGLNKYFPDVFQNEKWSELSSQEKRQTKELLFRTIHGSTPEEFRFDLYKKIAPHL